MTVDSTPRLVSDELRELLRLAREADSIELKLTVPEQEYRSTAAALGVDPLEAQIRQVFFFDTPDLRLNEAGVVARARRIQGRESDSTVKLRPVVPDQLPRRRARVRELRRRSRRDARGLRVLRVDEGQAGADCGAGVGVGRQAVAPPLLQGATGILRRPRTRRPQPRRPLGTRSDLRPQTEDEARPLSRRLVAEMWIYPDGRGSSSCRRSVCPEKRSTSPTRRARS